MRHDLQDRLGLKAVDIYGLSEIMGPGVACECHVVQSGLHGWEDHFLFETSIRRRFSLCRWVAPANWSSPH